jgi:N-acetylglucosamine-6-sulfatase
LASFSLPRLYVTSRSYCNISYWWRSEIVWRLRGRLGTFQYVLPEGAIVLRKLLVTALVVAATLLAACQQEKEKTEAIVSPPGGKPNIVLIVADDLDYSVFQRSTLDSVWVPKGASFTNALDTTSLCCPSRASILRGQYAHSTGLVQDDNDEPGGGAAYFRGHGLDKRTVATMLQANGYETWFGGKYLNGYETAGGFNGYVPPGWDHWQSYLSPINATVDGRKVLFTQHYTDWLSAQATTFIDKQHDPSKPFFMDIAPWDTHEPLYIPPRHKGAYLEQRAPRPPSFDEADVSDKPKWVRNQPPLNAQMIAAFDHQQVLRMQSALTLEDLCRDVIDALSRTKQLNDTYLIFTSDNGYHMGLHGIRASKFTPYTEAHEVPFVVRGPGVPGGRSFEELVGNIDIAPTLLNLAGASAPKWMDGRSFKPFLDGTVPNSWRTSLLIEGVKSGSPKRPGYSGVRYENSVYVKYTNGEQEHYDLKRDPYELENRPQDAPQMMKDKLAALKNCAGDSCRKAEGP